MALTITRQHIPASPNDLPEGLPDAQTHVNILLCKSARAHSLQTIRIHADQRAQHICAKRIRERSQALHGIQEYVRIVVLDGLQEYVADGRFERAHSLVGRASRADGHQFAQEEQAVCPDGQQCVLEKLKRPLIG
jgi:hypothetical protein